MSTYVPQDYAFAGFEKDGGTFAIPREFFSELLSILPESALKTCLYLLQQSAVNKSTSISVSMTVLQRVTGLSRGGLVAGLRILEDAKVISIRRNWDAGGEPGVSTYVLNILGGSSRRAEPKETPPKRLLVSETRRKTIYPGTRLKVYQRDNFRCRLCGSQEDLTIDHVIPVKGGGPHTIANYQTLCRSCNARKGAR